MVQLDPIEVELIARDAASQALKAFNQQIKDAEESSKKANTAFGQLSNAFKQMAIAAGLTVGAAQGFQFLKEGATNAALFNDQLRSLELQIGGTADALLGSLRTASQNTIADLDLLRSANKALAFEINQAQLPQLLEAATARARVMGITTTQAFDDIVTGIARGSPMILDNLGIKGIQGAMEAYAASTGRTVEELSDFERQQALVNTVIEKSRDLVALQKIVMDSQTTTIQQQKAEWENIKREIGEGFTPTLIGAGGALNNFLGILQQAGKGLDNLSLVFSDTQKISKLQDAYVKSGMTLNQFLTEAKDKVLQADGSFREFNATLDAPQLRIRLQDLDGLKIALGDSSRETDRMALQTQLFNKVVEDGNVSLDEANLLIQQNATSIGDIGQAWLKNAEIIAGHPIVLDFDISELEAAKAGVEKVLSDLDIALQKKDLTGDRLKLLQNIVTSQPLGGNQAEFHIDESQFMREGGFSSLAEMRKFLEENKIQRFTDSARDTETFIASAIARNEKEQERLTIVEKIGGQVEKDNALQTQIKDNILEATKAEEHRVETTTEYFNKVTTEGNNVVDIISKEASELERGAVAQERKTKAVQEELEARIALAALDGGS